MSTAPGLGLGQCREEEAASPPAAPPTRGARVAPTAWLMFPSSLGIPRGSIGVTGPPPSGLRQDWGKEGTLNLAVSIPGAGCSGNGKTVGHSRNPGPGALQEDRRHLGW